jgi:hypothetical protein
MKKTWLFSIARRFFYNSHEFFTSHKIEEGVGQFVDPIVGVTM